MGLQKIIVLSLVAMAMASLFINADVGVKEAVDPFCYETCGPSFGMLQCVQDCAKRQFNNGRCIPMGAETLCCCSPSLRTP
ncbi:unnamed protein product [Prunus armeniaca]